MTKEKIKMVDEKNRLCMKIGNVFGIENNANTKIVFLQYSIGNKNYQKKIRVKIY